MQTINRSAAMTYGFISDIISCSLDGSFLTFERWLCKSPASLFAVGLGVELETLDPTTTALPPPFVELGWPVTAALPPPLLAGLACPVDAYTGCELAASRFFKL